MINQKDALFLKKSGKYFFQFYKKTDYKDLNQNYFTQIIEYRFGNQQFTLARRDTAPKKEGRHGGRPEVITNVSPTLLIIEWNKNCLLLDYSRTSLISKVLSVSKLPK